MDERQPTTLISMRVPNDILAALPRASGYRTGKAGTGRNGVIVELLRWAINERNKQPDEGDALPPAFLSN